MKQQNSLIESFHEMWDAFPGMARLINSKHEILASNQNAQDKGYIPGAICASVPSANGHRGCLLAKTLQTGEGQKDKRFWRRIIRLFIHNHFLTVVLVFRRSLYRYA